MRTVGSDLARELRLLALDAENHMISEATIIALDTNNKVRKICLSSSEDPGEKKVTALRALS